MGRAEGLERAEPWELWGSLTLEALQGDNAVTGDEPLALLTQHFLSNVNTASWSKKAFHTAQPKQLNKTPPLPESCLRTSI